jgi:Tol biopolymer transport system component
VTLQQVCDDFRSEIALLFAGQQPDSIAYPVISPDGSRVFFKLSQMGDGQYRSANASNREGLFVYQLHDAKPIGFYPSWGHPAWMPDSRHILRMNVIIDTDTMQTRTIPWYPARSNSHASPSPDGKLLVMDVARDAFTAKEFHWAIVVGDDQENWQRIHTDPSPRHGTSSWRPVHPHPVFSNDGKRIYFNANFGDWTQLCVAEVRRPVVSDPTI